MGKYGLFFFPPCAQLGTTGFSEVNHLWEALFSYTATPLPFPCIWYHRQALLSTICEPKLQFLSVSIPVLPSFSLLPTLQVPPTMTSQRKRYNSSYLGLTSAHGIDPILSYIVYLHSLSPSLS